MDIHVELSLGTAVAAPLPFIRKTCRLLAEAEDVIILTGPTLDYAQRKQERQIPQIHSRCCLSIHQRPSTREMMQHRTTQFHSLKYVNCWIVSVVMKYSISNICMEKCQWLNHNINYFSFVEKIWTMLLHYFYFTVDYFTTRCGQWGPDWLMIISWVQFLEVNVHFLLSKAGDQVTNMAFV